MKTRNSLPFSLLFALLILIGIVSLGAFNIIADENPCLKQMRDQSAAAMPSFDEIDYGKNVGKIDEKVQDPFAKGNFSVSPFATLRLVDSNEEFGAGLSASYSLTRNLTLEAEVVGEDFNEAEWIASFREVGANLKWYFPIKSSGFAPYLIGGYKRDLAIHENRLAAGAGLELRLKQFAVFADARVVHGFDQELAELGNEVLIRLGGSYQF